MAWVAGADGCRAGWFVVLTNTKTQGAVHRCVPRFADLLALPEKPAIVAVDIPIGLLEHAVSGGRACDREARRLLGQPRARSVFSPPARSALAEESYEQAKSANMRSSPHRVGISIQCFCLFQKLGEAHECMTPSLQDRILETHPELCFYELNGGTAIVLSKKKRAGFDKRLRLLHEAGMAGMEHAIDEYPRSRVARDDILDAFVACCTAARSLKGKAVRIPDLPPCDAKGLRMEIWR